MVFPMIFLVIFMNVFRLNSAKFIYIYIVLLELTMMATAFLLSQKIKSGRVEVNLPTECEVKGKLHGFQEVFGWNATLLLFFLEMLQCHIFL